MMSHCCNQVPKIVTLTREYTDTREKAVFNNCFSVDLSVHSRAIETPSSVNIVGLFTCIYFLTNVVLSVFSPQLMFVYIVKNIFRRKCLNGLPWIVGRNIFWLLQNFK